MIIILKDLSKDESLDKIREKLIEKFKENNKMSEDFLFVDKDGDIYDKDLDPDSTLDDIIRNENGVLKKYISPPETDEEEKNKGENIIVKSEEPKIEEINVKEKIKNENMK